MALLELLQARLGQHVVQDLVGLAGLKRVQGGIQPPTAAVRGGLRLGKERVEWSVQGAVASPESPLSGRSERIH